MSARKRVNAPHILWQAKRENVAEHSAGHTRYINDTRIVRILIVTVNRAAGPGRAVLKANQATPVKARRRRGNKAQIMRV
jgi:hypothetical protein